MLKNIISGKNMELGDSGYHWQEQIKHKSKLFGSSEIDNQLNKLLEQIGNAELSYEIRRIVGKRERACAYAWYNQGLYEGVKSALILKKKNLKLPV